MDVPKPPLAGAAPQSRAPRSLTALAITMGVAAAAIVTPFVSGWESGGKQYLTPYRDIVGVWTQCDGETLGVTASSPKETPEGCAIKLDKRLAGFAQGALACTPSLRGHDEQWAAVTSLSYNIGSAAYCRSTVDRRFDAGDRRGACDAFLMWDKAGGRAVAGLTNRRRAERGLCLKGIK